MNFDFSLLLVIVTIVTGIIWGIDALFFAKKRDADARRNAITSEGHTDAATTAPLSEETEETGPREPILVEYARFLFPVVLVVLILRSFVAEPFRIPSGSMLPTLEIGDFILVNKFTYGIRLPVLNTEIIDFGEPERGDVIVFRYPENPSIDYIKRVVGVPGDEIAYYNKVLYINGKQAKQELDMPYEQAFPNLKRFKEDLDGTEHDILANVMYPAGDFVVTVPENSYFVMGDNRDNSRDSRYWGFVPEQNLVGKAMLVWMNWEWGHWPDLGRIGNTID
ncbi:MAG: signal peptidase I [Proteobacteria bacterium]|jgi:signal peptidase I|nr:signal peptidase I [Pseudomonadota bacterium]